MERLEPVNLEERRRILRLSKREVAKRAGIDETTVGRILRDEGDHRVSTLKAIDHVLASEEGELRKAFSPSGAADDGGAL